MVQAFQHMAADVLKCPSQELFGILYTLSNLRFAYEDYR